MNLAADPHTEVVRDTLQQRVAAKLRQMLIEGAIEPGAKLNERVLCERLSVSRTPLREAIRLLAAEGLVTLDPNRGAFAAALSADEIAGAFDVIAALEGLAGEQAAARISDAELAELRALQLEMQASFERRDLAAYYRLNARIHELINAAARNPVLTGTWRQLNARLHALRFRSNQDEEKWARALREHAAMVQALQERDAAAMRTLMVAHLQSKRDVVLARLAAEAQGGVEAGAGAGATPPV
jgi:DNA-binding GntR family transcriptional regulator